jgi:hypothetical protein
MGKRLRHYIKVKLSEITGLRSYVEHPSPEEPIPEAAETCHGSSVYSKVL